METNTESRMTGKRKSEFIDPVSYKPAKSSICQSLLNYFNETTKDEDNYINEVSNYFNMLNDTPDTCSNLPDVKKDNYTFEELSEGQQIYVSGKENENIIYIIKKKNNDNTITIQQNTINEMTEDYIISADKVENIININPASLHIDPTYLAKINITDPNSFNNNTKEGLILKIKYYKTKITICRIKLKKYENDKNDPRTDNAVAESNEIENLIKYTEKLQETIEELANISEEQSINIDDIKKVFRGLYGIGNVSNALDIFNNNIFTTFFKLDVKKDVIIRNYIILMDCLSVIGVAGIVESTNLLLKGTDPRSGWVYFCIETFIKNIYTTIPQPIKDGFINYALLPCISYYLFTNMDTLYLFTNDSLTTFFDYILCGLNKVRILNNEGDVGINRIDEDDDASSVYESTITTIKSISTFPSLSSIQTLNVFDFDKKIPITTSYGKELTEDLGIITQNNSVMEKDDDHEFPFESYPEGGKIKRSRMTKKQKRMTIRRSKRSKKMKGGKRTRSTKKRRVVRRRKHNTKKY